jgi:hypothetical protein
MGHFERLVGTNDLKNLLILKIIVQTKAPFPTKTVKWGFL